MDLKCCIYARKSSEAEEKQALSLEAQLNACNEIKNKLKAKVETVFQESQSAKTPGRVKFNQMIQEIEDGKIDSIITWKPDRLSRNPFDSAIILSLIDNNKLIQVITPSQTFNNDSMSKMMLGFFMLQAKFENDCKSDNVKRGLKIKAEKGWYPCVAPIGYLNTPNKDKGYKTITADSKRFPLIRKMWDLMLTGNHTVPKILKVANNEWGLTTVKHRRQGGVSLSRSGLYKIFSSPFYYGEFKYPKKSGNWHKGKHKPMITKEEFNRVQKLLNRKLIAKPKKHIFAFTGLIRCGECGASITASIKIKHYKRTNRTVVYTYYHCTKRKQLPCHQSPITKKELESEIKQILSQIRISKDFKDWALKYLHEIHHQETSDRSLINKSLQDAYNEAQKRIDNLIDLRVKEMINDDEYQKKKKKLTDEKDSLKRKLDNTDDRANKWLELTEKTFNLACYARYWFTHGNLEEKRQIISSIGSDFVLKDGNLSVKLEKPFLILKKAKLNPKLKAQRLELPKNIDLSALNGDLQPKNLQMLRGLDSNQ